MTEFKRPLRHAVCLAALLASAPAVAQGLDAEGAIDTIVGSEIKEEQADAAADAGKVLAAIDKTEENTSTVRKLTNLDQVEIVFLADAAQTEGGPPPEIEAKIEERKEAVETLRKEIEGNAMLYHAVNSRQILMRDILAIEFNDKSVVIYAATKPAN